MKFVHRSCGQVEQQNPMGAESGPKTSGTGNSTPTFDTTKFYPDEVPFRNQGTSTSPVVTKTTRNLPLQQNTGKDGKKKSSCRDQPETQSQPSISNGGTNTASVFPPRNAGTDRPHIQCSACGGNYHFRKDRQQDNFCTRCRSRSRATYMCRAPVNKGRNNNTCVHCGNTNHKMHEILHISGQHTLKVQKITS